MSTTAIKPEAEARPEVKSEPKSTTEERLVTVERFCAALAAREGVTVADVLSHAVEAGQISE